MALAGAAEGSEKMARDGSAYSPARPPSVC